MATKNQKSAANDVQNMFDPQNYQSVLKTWANMNERVTAMLVDAGHRSTEITSETANEALTNLRDVTQVRDEPAEYGQAYSDFVQKQMDLAMRTVQAYADVTQRTGSKASELASEAGEKVADKVSENADRAADKASSAAKKAA